MNFFVLLLCAFVIAHQGDETAFHLRGLKDLLLVASDPSSQGFYLVGERFDPSLVAAILACTLATSRLTAGTGRLFSPCCACAGAAASSASILRLTARTSGWASVYKRQQPLVFRLEAAEVLRVLLGIGRTSFWRNASLGGGQFQVEKAQFFLGRFVLALDIL
jgi:hypothetical protein